MDLKRRRNLGCQTEIRLPNLDRIMLINVEASLRFAYACMDRLQKLINYKAQNKISTERKSRYHNLGTWELISQLMLKECLII